MTKTDWLKNTADAALQDRVAQKIAAIQTIESDLPAILVVHNIQDDSIVYMSERGRRLLGVTLDEVRISHADYHRRYFNPEDAAYYAPRILALMERNLPEETVSYFQQVRTGEQKEWTWYLSCTRIWLQDEGGKPLLLLTVAQPIDSRSHINTKVERLRGENSFFAGNHHIFESLTRREKEILRLMALGRNSVDIAQSLHISEATANTHRRNIRKKINAQTPYDITRFAQAFDLI